MNDVQQQSQVSNFRARATQAGSITKNVLTHPVTTAVEGLAAGMVAGAIIQEYRTTRWGSLKRLFGGKPGSFGKALERAWQK